MFNNSSREPSEDQGLWYKDEVKEAEHKKWYKAKKKKMLSHIKNNEHRLSRREKEVLRETMSGLSMSKVGEKLGITKSSVQSFLSTARNKILAAPYDEGFEGYK